MRRLSVMLLVACGSRDEIARCRELGTGTLRSSTIVVNVGSTVRGDSIESGTTIDCDRVPAASALFVAASDVIPTIPDALRPPQVTIHYAPALPVGAKPIQQLELHRPTGALLAAGTPVPRPVWLHELAHVRMLGARPTAAIPSRVFAALEEGIADYYAARILGSPNLGARSLTSPPRITADDWAAIASPSFDPHRLGWKLAASLWSSDARVEEACACMTATVDYASDARVSTAIGAWLAACPTETIRRVVCEWLPAELASACR